MSIVKANAVLPHLNCPDLTLMQTSIPSYARHAVMQTSRACGPPESISVLVLSVVPSRKP